MATLQVVPESLTGYGTREAYLLSNKGPKTLVIGPISVTNVWRALIQKCYGEIPIQFNFVTAQQVATGKADSLLKEAQLIFLDTASSSVSFQRKLAEEILAAPGIVLVYSNKLYRFLRHFELDNAISAEMVAVHRKLLSNDLTLDGKV